MEKLQQPRQGGGRETREMGGWKCTRERGERKDVHTQLLRDAFIFVPASTAHTHADSGFIRVKHTICTEWVSIKFINHLKIKLIWNL